MNIITPLNPDVHPEEPTTTTPAAPVIAANSAQPPLDTLQQPIATQAPAATPSFDPTNIYPTGTSGAGRLIPKEEREARKAQFSMAISQIGIPIIVGGLSLYSLVRIIPSLFKAGMFNAAAGFSDGFARQLWLFVLFIVVQLVFGVIISIKIFKGSKTALALLTGPAVIYLQISLLASMSTGTSQLFIGVASFKSAIAIIVQLSLAILLLLAWTREKKHYS